MADINGTNGIDVLDGTGDIDTIQGLAGRDTLRSLAGADILSGGDGADHLIGGEGADTLYGHSAADLDPNSGNIEAVLLTDVGAGAVFLTSAPGDNGFVYALKKDAGQVVRIDLADGTQSTFLDIADSEFASGGERGVLGLAYHPDYAANGRFFVFLTNADGNLEVREYARSAGDPTVADATLVKTTITIPHPDFANHNGGYIGFGPDGDLYISTGDGGGGNDPNGNAQNIDVLLGKILRIDIDGDDFPADPSRNYAIPADNPFAGATPGAGEIWDYGLRNPFRMSFDRVTGDLYIGDVGQGAREEVDFEAAGGHGGFNYGWDYREGTIQGPSAPPDPPIAFTDPVYDYAQPFGFVITGGYVNRGPVGGLQGSYFFTDFATGRLLTLRMIDGVAEEIIDHTEHITGATLSNISSFGEDSEGNLYAVSLSGAIYRLIPGPAAGDQADTLDGGAGADNLFGGQGDDVLIGGAGADQLNGGDGSDWAGYVGSAAVSVNLATGAVSGGDASGDVLIGIEKVIGSAFADQLTGNDGANSLNGASGADVMVGLGGNDNYIVDNPQDIADESVAGSTGTDSIYSSAFSIDLADTAHFRGSMEGIGLLGSANLNATGNSLRNTLVGNSGNNILNGAAGADVMRGGAGNDNYLVDDAGDIVDESVAGSGGADGVFSSAVSIDLSDATRFKGAIESVGLTGSANLNATGNGFNNFLLGNSGNNTLNGGAGADILRGMSGNDNYVVDNAGDIVDESVAGSGGTDAIYSSAISVNLGDAAHYRGAIENAVLNGSANLNLFGGAGANTLVGNSGNNVFDGKLGADTMVGGAGNDVFRFDTGLGGGNVDRVTDYATVNDQIQIDNAVFTGLANGALAVAAFFTGAAAHDADDRIIYNSATGALFFDSDGTGATAQIQFATLSAGLAMAASEFTVV